MERGRGRRWVVAALPVRQRLDGIWVWRSGSGLRGAFMARSVVRDQMTWCRWRAMVAAMRSRHRRSRLAIGRVGRPAAAARVKASVHTRCQWRSAIGPKPPRGLPAYAAKSKLAASHRRAYFRTFLRYLDVFSETVAGLPYSLWALLVTSWWLGWLVWLVRLCGTQVFMSLSLKMSRNTIRVFVVAPL